MVIHQKKDTPAAQVPNGNEKISGSQAHHPVQRSFSKDGILVTAALATGCNDSIGDGCYRKRPTHSDFS